MTKEAANLKELNEKRRLFDNQSSAEDLDQTMTYADVARYLGVNVRTVRRLVAREEIPHVRLGYRSVRFSREAVRDWFKSQERRSY